MGDSTLSFGGGHIADVDPDRLQNYLDELDAVAAVDRDSMLGDLASFRQRLSGSYGEGFALMSLLHNVSLEAVNLSEAALDEALVDDSDEESYVRYFSVIHGLAARALLAYDEVSWLLQGGYPKGAYARIRTLHELYVAVGVLAKYGHPGGTHPELIERYLMHHEVFTLKTATELAATEYLEPGFFDAETLDQLETKRKALLEKYGKSFNGMWGWAAPLVGGPTRAVHLSDLSPLVDRTIDFFYGLSSSHVHAGSQGWHENFGDVEKSKMVAGPTNMGLAAPGSLAVSFLASIIEFTVPTIIEVDGDKNDDGSFFLAGVRRVAVQAQSALSAGEQSVTDHEEPLQPE
jgi:hypothetical protein